MRGGDALSSKTNRKGTTLLFLTYQSRIITGYEPKPLPMYCVVGTVLGTQELG